MKKMMKSPGKAGGVKVKVNNASVPDNNKVRTQKSNAKSSGGVNANFKAVPKKAGGTSPGGVNTPIKKVSPSK
jgi:hypothetical protein